MNKEPIPLVLFAKAPIPGKVKTRLQTHCSDVQAAGIAEILLEASLERATASWPGSVYISTYLDKHHPKIRQLSERYNVPIILQCSGDLGAKMQHTFAVFGYPAAIMGCDVPHVSHTSLVELYQCLRGGQNAIGPSLDGGYYAIGLSQAAPSLFENMPWGSSKVMSLTRKKISEIDFRVTELNPLQDVDEWVDVLAVKELIPKLENYVHQQDLIKTNS